MPYQTQEISQYGGAPVELFLFRDTVGQTVAAYTTGEDEVLDGLTNYLPGVIGRSSIRQTNDDPSGNLTLQVPADSVIAEKFRTYLPARPISLTIYRYHLTDVSLERRALFAGEVVSVQFDGDGLATLACESVIKDKGRKVPWVPYKKGCVWAHYGHGCGVARLPFEVPTSTYSQTGNVLSSAAFGAFADGWFRGGTVEVSSTGEQRFVLAHTGNNLTLDYPFFNLPIGEPLVAVAGCDRSEETCATKFNNLPNHLGFSYIPTENPYDTNFGPAGDGVPATAISGSGLLGIVKSLSE